MRALFDLPYQIGWIDGIGCKEKLKEALFYKFNEPVCCL
jgi:hypothetical protein